MGFSPNLPISCDFQVQAVVAFLLKGCCVPAGRVVQIHPPQPKPSAVPSYKFHGLLSLRVEPRGRLFPVRSRALSAWVFACQGTLVSFTVSSSLGGESEESATVFR